MYLAGAHKIPRLIRSQIFPHMSSLTNLDKSRWQFSFWDKRGHSFSSFTEARLSLLLLLWYSARGIKQPNSQSNIVPFGLKSAHFMKVIEKCTFEGCEWKVHIEWKPKAGWFAAVRGLVRPELDVWHPINGSIGAKRKESRACQLDMSHTTIERSHTTIHRPPITIERPPTIVVFSSSRPPPSLVSWCRPPIDGGDGSEMKLIRRKKGGNLHRAVNHCAWDRVHTWTKVRLVQPEGHIVSLL